MRKLFLICFLCMTLSICLNSESYCGVVSKAGKYAAKVISKKGFTKTTKSLTKKNIDNLSLRYGDNIVYKINNLASQSPYNKSKLIKEITSHGNIYRKHGFSENALRFGIDNKNIGRNVLKDFDISEISKLNLINTNSKKSLNAVWRLTDEYAIGGSKKRLLKLLKKNGINPEDCISLKNILNRQDKFDHLTFKKLNPTHNKYLTNKSTIAKNRNRNINSQYTGKKYPQKRLPLDIQNKYPKGVRFSKDGYPDFSPYSKKTVKVDGLNGNYANDFARTNKAAGFKRTPDGYTWHHHQDCKTMQLVPSDLHRAIRHSGGASKLRYQQITKG